MKVTDEKNTGIQTYINDSYEETIGSGWVPSLKY